MNQVTHQLVYSVQILIGINSDFLAVDNIVKVDADAAIFNKWYLELCTAQVGLKVMPVPEAALSVNVLNFGNAILFKNQDNCVIQLVECLVGDKRPAILSLLLVSTSSPMNALNLMT